MTKSIIKIGVPLLVLVVIIAVIAITQKSINKLSSDLRIEPLDFKTYVEHYISDNIEGQTRSDAKNGYDNLYKIISTEDTITATTPNGRSDMLSSQDADECYENAFKAYFSIFGNSADQLFASSTWSEGELKSIKEESERLKYSKGSDYAKDSLIHYINYVDGYNSAINLISNSKFCKSASSYESYCNRSKSYNRFPYTNNSKLRNITSDVAKNADEGWRNSITQYVDNVCNRDYNSYEEFYYGNYQDAYGKIDEYNDKFKTSWGANLKTKLNNKKDELK